MRQTVLSVLLVLAAVSSTRALASPVTLLSKADPSRPSGSAGGRSTVQGISADGRYVAFVSDAANLLGGVEDANDNSDVFLHDSVAGTTTLVSHAAGDPFTAADAGSEIAVLSADGRYVAFLSFANDLVAGQFGGGSGNIFLYDRVTGGTALVSHVVGQATWATGGAWSRLEISADGGKVVYDSFASNLVAGQSDNSFSVDLFLYDRAAGTNTLVSHTSASATTAAGGVGDAAISADGSRVAFLSDAANLVAGQSDANGTLDAFLYDAGTGAVSLVSHAAGAAATAGNGIALDVKISADGAWVGILSAATNLVAGQSDANGGYDIFLHERATGTNTLASRIAGSAVTTANGYCWALSLSADGRYAAFSSDSSNLAANDASTTVDIFLFDRVAGTTALVSRSGYQDTPAGGHSMSPEISADGAWVAFTSTATNLVVGQTGPDVPQTGIFLWQRASNAVTIVSHADGSPTSGANGESQAPFRLSANAGRIAMASFASDLDAGIDDANANADVFLFDRASGGNTLLSVRDGAVSQAAGSYFFVSPPGLSNDGRYTAFTSAAPNLVPGLVDENNGTDVFLHDRLAGTLKLVSRSRDSPSRAGDLRSYSPVMSTDGSAILFFSLARDLVPGQVTTSDFGHLFVYDRASGAVSMVDHAAGSPATTTDASPAGLGEFTLSGDGRWIAFSSFGTDLIAGQTEGSGGADIFLRDRLTGQTTLVSHAASLPARTGNASSTNPVLSADGRWVAFQSSATDLIAPGGTGGLFLYDRVAGTTVKASASGYAVNLSGDGRWLLFASDATNVVPGQVDTNGSTDLFLWDRVAGSTVLVSRAASSPTTTVTGGAGPGSLDRGRSLLSVDGRWVVFSSRGTNLVTGVTDTNSVNDVFLYDRVAGTVSLVSRASYGGATGLERSEEPAISADGRWITFRSQAPDLVSGQMETGSSYDDDFFLHDRTAGTTSLVSHIPGSELTPAGAPYGFLELARPSADGAWVVFETPGAGLVTGDLDGQADTFLHANPLPGRDFFTVTPCRVLNTQQLTSGVEWTVMVSGTCGIPATARAIAANVTVIGPSDRGRLTLHPGDLAAPLTSTINFAAGENRANNALLALALDGTGTLSLTPFVIGGGTVQAILDVSGYFE